LQQCFNIGNSGVCKCEYFFNAKQTLALTTFLACINVTLIQYTVWTLGWAVDFETPVCKLYLLFIYADAAQEKEKKEESAAAHWCFKVHSPYSNTILGGHIKD
jgi:hypothetical protein